jgi:pimeloyl-ACP methyl ester carboxylesterase
MERGRHPRLRRWLRRLGLAVLALIVALTLASLAYNAVTADESKAPRALYHGPFAHVDGTWLAYRRWGTQGTPIVLIGGFVEPSWVWHALGPLLAPRHRVYAVDLPPFGYSQRRGPYTLAHWLALVRGFERTLGIVRPLVVGHSLGAAVAVAGALRDPHAQRGIVLLDGDALAEGGPGWLTQLLLSPWYTTVYRIVTTSDWIFRRALGEAYGKQVPHLDHATLAQWERPFEVAGTAAAFRELLSHGILGWKLDDLRRVRGPRLVVWGAEDTVDSVSAGRTSAAALHARFVLVPHAGHLSMLANPRALARVLETAAKPS